MIGIKDQYFGTEIEMTGITRQRAAEVVAEMFGTEAYYDGTTYGVWSVIDLEGKKWKFMSDGSIYTQRKVYGRIVDAGGEYSTEMVSPKLSYDEMGKLQEVVRCLRQHGGFVNESCGQHVHVDASNHTPQSLKNALTIMYAKEDILFKALKVQERRANSYCQRVRPEVLEKIRKIPNKSITMDLRGNDGRHHAQGDEREQDENGLPFRARGQEQRHGQHRAQLAPGAVSEDGFAHLRSHEPALLQDGHERAQRRRGDRKSVV